jgi:uncharacterized phage protein (TIGR01671 family)
MGLGRGSRMKRKNREIVFRAWDKLNKAIYPNPFSGKIGGMNDIFANASNLIYMQYTGREDREGTMMFEGDIIMSSSGHKINIQDGQARLCNSFEIGEIIYNQEDTRYEVLVWKQKESRYDGKLPYPRPLNYYPWAVIGNIYENPELIE